MNISDTGLALIKRFEGCSLTPYLCPAGYWTIGYGHVITASEKSLTRITPEQADEYLQNDTRLAAQAVSRLIAAPLTQHQFDALVSFTFNLGAGALQRSTVRRTINRGDHHDVPRELLRWVWAGGRKLPGLIARRGAEGELYQGNQQRLSQHFTELSHNSRTDMLH